MDARQTTKTKIQQISTLLGKLQSTEVTCQKNPLNLHVNIANPKEKEIFTACHLHLYKSKSLYFAVLYEK